jgi:hypothetical protein
MAQDSGFNAGLELSIPMGDFGDMFSLGYGLGLGYDSEAGNQGLLGLSVSYSGLSSKEDMFTKGSMIQLMGHYKYFFDDVREGIYVAPYLGWSMVAYRLEYSIPGVIDYSGDETAGGLAFGAGAGYVVNERIDIGVRYQIIRATEDGDATASAGEASSSLGFFGLRAGYNF